MPKQDVLSLRLYVAGSASNSSLAIANIRALCAKHFPAAHDLEIVDMIQHPKRALADGIIVSPTLMKLSPPPARRLIGNLSDTEQVLLTLAGR